MNLRLTLEDWLGTKRNCDISSTLNVVTASLAQIILSDVSCSQIFHTKFWAAVVKFICMWVLRPWQMRTHCRGHIVADTNVSPFARTCNFCCGHRFCVRDTKNVSDFVQKHFVSATNVSQFAQPKKHHGQQCVCNNVSLFTRAFKFPVAPGQKWPKSFLF